MHYLYKITSQDNKVYIGQSNDPFRRWSYHKNQAKKDNPIQYIHRAMNKCGVDNFQFEIIAICQTQEDANETEILLIKQYDSRNKEYGYNIESGGNNAPMSEESKEKLRIVAANRSEDYYDYLLNNKHAKGIVHTEEWKQNKSNRIQSQEEKDKRTQSLLKYYETHKSPMMGVTAWNKGIPMREETKQKLSQSLMGHIPGNKINFTKEQIAFIIIDPRTCKEIAQDYNVSIPTIWKIKKEAGTNKSVAESKKVKCSLTKDQAALIREEYAADPRRGKQTELAKKYGVRQQLINKLLNEKSYHQ